MKKTVLLSLVFMTAVASNVFSQPFLGYRQSNYAGVAGGDLNPANIADSRFIVDVTLGGADVSFYNDYGYMNTHLMPYWWSQSFDDQDPAVNTWQSDPDYGKIISADSADHYINMGQGNFFEFANPKNKPRTVYFATEVDVLNFMVTINPTMAFSVGVKSRTFLNIDHLSNDLITLARNGLDYEDLWGLSLDDQLVNVSFNSWVEYNAGFGMVVLDDEEHFIKAGVKAKFLQGLGSLYLYTKDVKYNVFNDDTLAQLQGNFDYGYSANIDQHWDASSSQYIGDAGFGEIYQLQSKLGFGADLGVVYEYRPDWKEYKYDMDGETNLWRRDKNKYLLKVSFALNDLGGMKYAKSENSRNFGIDINTSDPNQMLSLFQFSDDTEGLESFNQNVDTLVQNGGATYNDDKANFYMNLPTHMNLGVDYNIYNDFYVNLSTNVGFQMNRNAHKVRYPTQVSLTPRYDFAWAGLSFPISYGKVHGFRAGAGLRAGPIIIGTSDLKWVFAPGKNAKVRGMNLYAALRVPILYGHPKDTDLDKVSDKLDLCVETPGVWEFKGCPDTDGDGIQDSEDACPTEAGPKEFQGCPDRDGDKIIDLKDDCPDDPGLAEFNGCPDTDGDKIIDKNDDCPEVAGIELFKGCPDTDGDGLKDSDDLCPEHPGPIVNQGCPDTDNDGIFDYLDGCPEQAGPEENNGCPWPDTDEDGLLDKDDKCPYNAGPPENEGCPYTDTDGDGVIDKEDECVNVPGPVENKGCPEVDEEIIKRAFDNLEFESARAIIKETSYSSLADLATYLVENADFKLKIAGHTDSDGGDQANMILSKKRAEAVRDFLESRGVAKERCTVMWFGETQPIADNSTAEGRQKNRRVEMEIIFE
ncbi:MAG: DUF5723 family protein [Flavobacteriales bacterium]|nr:DUF5723 family protein [Flavobacteriales bacterium]